MEGLTNEMGREISLADHHHQHQVGGKGGAEQEEERGAHNKGKKKKGGGSGGNNGGAGGSAGGGGGGGGMLRTPADVFEHPTFYSFILDMPGVDTQNIKVKVENGILHVTGKRKKNKQSDETTSSASSEGGGGGGVKALRLERRRARYMRKFTLPPTANPEDVKANYKDGVLTISISKIPPNSISHPINT